MSSLQLAPVLKDTHSAQTIAVTANTRGGSPSEDCTRIRELGYKLSGYANLYGEKFEIVSDPFPEGGGVAVRVATARGGESPRACNEAQREWKAPWSAQTQRSAVRKTGDTLAGASGRSPLGMVSKG